MDRIDFNTGWTYGRRQSPFLERIGMATPPRPVALPHDAMLRRERSADLGSDSAFYPGGSYRYTKRFVRQPEWEGRRVLLEFEAVYRDARVQVNGTWAGGWANGYTEFALPVYHLLVAGENVVEVECVNGEDSRWYSGAGLIRPVHLLVSDRCHIARHGLLVTTPEMDGEGALAAVAVTVVNEDVSARSLRVRLEIVDADGTVVGADSSPLHLAAGRSEVVRSRVYLAGARRWSCDTPHLYRARVWLTDERGEVDRDEVTFGVRSLGLDAAHGLRINGEVVKLRGACVHHDNGPLGGAAVARAEERRIELLKAAGFNAVRASHNPLSRAMLEACDRLGVLVMDEFSDVWTRSKTDHDYARDFPQWWERDIEAMVAKDVNHPSVVLYCIGNEIPESGDPTLQWIGRAIAEKVRSLDPTRYVASAVSGMLAMRSSQLRALGRARVEAEAEGGINTIMSRFQKHLDEILAGDDASDEMEPAFSYTDVAGFNYMPLRYPLEGDRFPNRVVVGSETHGPAIDLYWREVATRPNLIGDFCWTGWDYLGEVGVGRTTYAEDSADAPMGFMAGFPWLTAWAGDLTITGHRRPLSYYRETVFGLRDQPTIAVWRPEHHGKTPQGGPWAWSDSEVSWSWAGYEGRPVTVDVYADADEVDLLVNGESWGRQAVLATREGDRLPFLARFEATYTPGEITAVSFRGGAEIGRTTLRSTDGHLALRLTPDRPQFRHDPSDVCFVTVAIADAAGTVSSTAAVPVTVSVSGPGELAGFATDDPRPTENFGDSTRTTFEGRALAVVRATATGEITITCTAEGFESTRVVVRAS